MNQAVAMKSVLDGEEHERLLQDIQNVAFTARVPVSMLHKSARPYLTEDELDWLLHIRRHPDDGVAGLCIIGKTEVPVDVKMMAMVSALVRNFIDARIVPVTELLGEVLPNPKVMVIPNFCTSFDGKPLPSWQIQKLHSMLVDRFVHECPTILYVQNMDKMEQLYGTAVHDFIDYNYTKLGV
jgi:hypothetical protein